MTAERVFVFIDGNNFYHKLKSLKLVRTSQFDFRKFAEWLARDRRVLYRGYYIGVVRAQQNDAKGQMMRDAQRKLFNRLIDAEQGFAVKKGYLMQSDGAYHEKGVDVQMAVDLLVGAYEKLFDIAILVTSDTDLIPAIAKVRQLGKSVEYIGFAHQPSLALQKYASLSRLLIKEEVEQFIPPFKIN